MMKSFVFLFILFFTVQFCFAQQNLTLSGSIKDRRGEALPGTGIFVSGYKIATVADNTGVYQLSLKPGNYDILFQLIGYKAVSKNVIISDKPVKLDVLLEESITQLSEVTIKPDPNRAYYIGMFRDFFIGITENAADCKIVNPNVLLIDYDKEFNRLTVKTNEFLIIENQALGYNIKYLIKQFEWDSKTRVIYYEGFPYYEDLKGSERKQKIWAKKRLTAYLGSPQHFFKSLYQNKATEEGFIINKIITKVNTERPSDSLINRNIKRLTKMQISLTGKIVIDGSKDDSLSYWMKKKNLNRGISILNRAPILEDTLVKIFNPNIKAINFTDKLYVIYTKDTESPLFTNRLGQSISRPLDMPNHQISTIDLQVAPVYFYANGGVYNPRSMLYSGYWAWEKIADSVPMDYIPTNKR